MSLKTVIITIILSTTHGYHLVTTQWASSGTQWNRWLALPNDIRWYSHLLKARVLTIWTAALTYYVGVPLKLNRLILHRILKLFLHSSGFELLDTTWYDGKMGKRINNWILFPSNIHRLNLSPLCSPKENPTERRGGGALHVPSRTLLDYVPRRHDFSFFLSHPRCRYRILVLLNRRLKKSSLTKTFNWKPSDLVFWFKCTSVRNHIYYCH